MNSMPKIIQDASVMQQSAREVRDGIIDSGMLTSFQRTCLDGVIQSAVGMPQDKAPAVKKVKAGATKADVGFRKFPGSRYA